LSSGSDQKNINVEYSKRFTQRNYFFIFFSLVAWMTGACNYSSNSSNPVNYTPQPTLIIASPSPTAMPEKTATPIIHLSPSSSPENTRPAKPSGCFDDMKIQATFGGAKGDDTVLSITWPGKSETISWRIMNGGTCVWDSAYSFVQVNNSKVVDVTGSQTKVLKERVRPGESIVVQFQILAPIPPGDYFVSWVLINGYRKTVGQPLQAILRVPSDSGDRPLPTMTLISNIQFNASITEVAPYDRVVISWEVRQAKKVYFYTTGQAYEFNQVPLKGARVYFPANDTAYNLRVVSLNNTVESRKIEVIVEPPRGLPNIILFALEPKGRLVLGGCVDISWRVRGGLSTSVSLLVNDVLLLSDEDRTGEYSDCPTQTGLFLYTLVASGPAGTVRKSKAIHVEP
jgi:Ig-like domain from next to BRCA1 gene